MKPGRFWIIFGWAFLLLALHAFGQGGPPDGYTDEFVDHGPDAFNMMFLLMFLVFIAVCCVLIGIGLAIGLALLAGLAVMLGAGGMMFGVGGVAASLAGGIASRRPKVGWRIFSMWMHAGLMTLAGAGIGGVVGLVLPHVWLDGSSPMQSALAGLISGLPLQTTVLGGLAGLIAGLLWGWLLALGVERCGGSLKAAILPRLGLKAGSDKLETSP